MTMLGNSHQGHKSHGKSTMISRLLAFILAVSFVLLAVNLPVHAEDAGVTATVTSLRASVQSGPGLEFPQVTIVKNKEVFPVLGRARGSNRVWYKIQLPDGQTGWISERIVTIDPSPDSLPWLGDNNTKVPLAMDCGTFPMIFFVGATVQPLREEGTRLYKEPGIGKPRVGSFKFNEEVDVVDGPFCTRRSATNFEVQWLVKTAANLQGYMFERGPDGQGGYISFVELGGNAADGQVGDSTSTDPNQRPKALTNEAISDIKKIFISVQKGDLTEADTRKQLQQWVTDNGKESLAWVVRRVAIYDGKVMRWQSFARYEDLSVMEFKSNSTLDNDPVSLTIDILFGHYQNITKVFEAMGCGG